MATVGSTRAALLAAIPELRAFAISLCGSTDRGDDLVQETLLRAWSHLAQFRNGTNMGAWLFTILRNQFLNDYRKRGRYVEDVDGRYAAKVAVEPEQDGWAITQDLRYALERVPVHQREALILVGGAGMTVSEAAAVCGCEPGTIKSRVNRGRVRLADLLSDAGRGGEAAPPDGYSRAATARSRRHCLPVVEATTI